MKKLLRLFWVFSVLFSAGACTTLSAPAKTSNTAAISDTPVVTATASPNQAAQPAETSDTPPAQNTLKPSEELHNIWNNIRNDQDITVLPPAAASTPADSQTAAPATEKNKPDKTPTAKTAKPKVKVQLRKPPVAATRQHKAKSLPQTAPVVKMPSVKAAPPAPALTRRQILEREINRERTALKAAQSQLNAARKKGNTSQINRLINIIKDRELNIKAITKEMVK